MTVAEDPALIPARWRWPARLTFLGVFALTVVLLAFGLPVFYRQMSQACVAEPCYNSPSPAVAQTFAAAGISLAGGARYFVALVLGTALVHGGVALLIFWRRSQDRMAWFTALTLLIFGTVGIHNTPIIEGVLAQFAPIWRLPVFALIGFSTVSISLFYFVFPNGHFAPRWLRWPVLVWLVFQAVAVFWPGSALNPDTWPVALNLLYWLTFFGACIYAQVYHFRKVSSFEQRRQTKWVVLGVALALLGSLLALLGLTVLPELVPAWAFLSVTRASSYYIFLQFVPLSIGFAMFRSGLWDVDVIINRALVYGVLTMLLAGIYAVLVIGLQALFTRFTGQTSDLALIGSTLAIVALFQPLRRGVAAFIDQRFYRRRYDGQQVLSAFAGVLRDRPYTDPDDLRQVLLSVVDETIQPAHVSLRLVEGPAAPKRAAGG